MTSEDTELTISRAAEHLGLTYAQLQWAVVSGKLKCRRLGSGQKQRVLIARSDLDAYGELIASRPKDLGGRRVARKEGYVSVREAARILGISRTAVYKLITKGRLQREGPHIPLGSISEYQQSKSMKNSD